MEEVFSILLREPIQLVGAGRTDAGVHAKQMYAHFDAGPVKDLDALVNRCNSFLPEDIAVMGIYKVPEGTHARFDAIERTYEYWVVQQKDPFYIGLAHYVRQPLNIDMMNKVAARLIAKMDFECFSRSNSDVGTFICDVRRAQWESREGILVFTISADRFLRNMVRAIVGTLLEAGQGRLGTADMQRILQSGDRAEAGASVPAKGLYLTAVVYPQKIKLNGYHG
tara:strand:- start:38429 stop:39100 length:672 start_codon:yes stop_codon:yes gene_type:complete